MIEPLPVAKSKTTELQPLPALANRHGLIAGATGNGARGVLGSILGGGGKRRW